MVEAAAGIATLMMGETVENVAAGIDCYSYRQPLGVSARRARAPTALAMQKAACSQSSHARDGVPAGLPASLE